VDMFQPCTMGAQLAGAMVDSPLPPNLRRLLMPFTYTDLIDLALNIDLENPDAVAAWRDLYLVHHNAMAHSKTLGYVGVGCITYSDNALTEAYNAHKGAN
jgi:hypothetical protein